MNAETHPVHATIRLLFLGLLLMVTVEIAGAQEDSASSEKAEAILDRYVEATGGLDAYDALQNRYSRSTFELPGMGLVLKAQTWTTRNKRFLSVASSEATGDIRRGYDGEVFWETSIMSGPRIVEGPELAEAIREATFEQYVYWRDVFESASYDGTDTVNGAMCDKVVLTPAEGNPHTLYFDQESGLLVMVESVIDHQMGQVSLKARMSDFREIDGIKAAFATEIEVMGQLRKVTMDTVIHNIEMPDSLFAPPAEIHELMEAAPAPEMESEG